MNQVQPTFRFTLTSGVLLLAACVGPTGPDPSESTLSVSELAEVEFVRVPGPEAGGSVVSILEDSWRSWFVGMPTVIHDGRSWRMYFTAQRLPAEGESVYVTYLNSARIGSAVSTDGVHWEVLDMPVLTQGAPGTFDQNGVSHPHVLYENGVYRMWYGGIDGTQAENLVRRERLGLAESLDGVHFERVGEVLGLGPSGSYDEVQVTGATVIRVGSKYLMWYGAYSLRYHHTLMLAESHDGRSWSKPNGSRPVSGLAPEGIQVLGPSVFSDGHGFFMLYSRNDGGYWAMHAATSPDGVNWTALGQVLGDPEPGAFDDFVVGQNHSVHPSQILWQDGEPVLWYMGESKVRPFPYLSYGHQRIGMVRGRLNN